MTQLSQALPEADAPVFDNSQFSIPKEQYRDRAYEQELYARFHQRTPEKVFDAHFHVSRDEVPGVDAAHVFDACIAATNKVLGDGRVQGGLLMGNPKMFKSQQELDEERLFTCETVAAHPGFYAGLLATPTDTAAELDGWLERYPQIAALKPYRSYAPVPDTYEADILDYAPEWMWELADARSLAVVLHLSHYGDMLKDRRNGEQIQYLCKKYPGAKMILAHCAMGHHPDKLKSGLPYLKGLENVWMDCSGISEALSIIYALQAMSPQRVFYGSDGYNFGQMLGRVMAVGGNFLGIHDGDTLDLPPDYHYKPLNNLCEGVLALYAAGDIYGLTDSQWQDVFYNNAQSLFSSCRC